MGGIHGQTATCLCLLLVAVSALHLRAAPRLPQLMSRDSYWTDDSDMSYSGEIEREARAARETPEATNEPLHGDLSQVAKALDALTCVCVIRVACAGWY